MIKYLEKSARTEDAAIAEALSELCMPYEHSVFTMNRNKELRS